MPSIVIIDYGSGNLHSIAKAVECQAKPLGLSVVVSDNVHDIKQASRIVLPGVGAFADCVSGLNSRRGVVEELKQSVLVEKKPFLGICVGMQMLADKGFERGEHKGLGWIAGEVVNITQGSSSLKVPHMGWNSLVINDSHRIVDGIKTGDHAYFVHSYHMQCIDKNRVLAEVEYGRFLTAIIANENIVATQFHPEKSQDTGMRLIRNFLNL